MSWIIAVTFISILRSLDRPTSGEAVLSLNRWWRIQMQKLITRKLSTTAALLILGTVLGSAAMAQTGTRSQNNSASSSKTAPVPEAPVGHRQPRADQVPSEKNLSDPNDPVNREDAALDKKIKSICRGC
jgi:hypothetical protein